MNKTIKQFGKGFIFGIKHPFNDVYPADRYSKLDTLDSVVDGAGIGLAQGVIQGVIGYGIFIVGMAALGYACTKIDTLPLKVEMVVDNPKKK